MSIEYKINAPVSTDQFIELLLQSTLSERRPIEDRDCMEGMVTNSNLMVSAWADEVLVGIARSVTDFHYACYLSDLAVHKKYQRSGIGKKLQIKTQEQLGPKCKLILIAALSPIHIMIILALQIIQGVGFLIVKKKSTVKKTF